MVLADEVIVVGMKASTTLGPDAIGAQLATYALVVASGMRLPLRQRVWNRRVLDLDRGDDHLVLWRRLDVARAGIRIIGDPEVVVDLNWEATPYNAVDEVVDDQLGRGARRSGRGSVRAGGSWEGSRHWGAVWYNRTIRCTRLNSIRIE